MSLSYRTPAPTPHQRNSAAKTLELPESAYPEQILPDKVLPPSAKADTPDIGVLPLISGDELSAAVSASPAPITNATGLPVSAPTMAKLAHYPVSYKCPRCL